MELDTESDLIIEGAIMILTKMHKSSMDRSALTLSPSAFRHDLQSISKIDHTVRFANLYCLLRDVNDAAL